MTDIIGTERPTLSALLPLQRRAAEARPALEVVDLEPRSSSVADSVLLTPTEVSPLTPPAAEPRQASERALLVAADVAAGALAGLVDWRLGLLAAAVAVPATTLAGLHRRRFSLSLLDDAPRVLRASGWIGAGIVLLTLATGAGLGSAAVAAVLSTVGLLAFRGLAYARTRGLRRSGRSVHPVVLVGPSADDIARRIEAHPETGLRVVGIADAHGMVRFTEGGSASVSSAIERYGVRDLILDACGDKLAVSAWVRNLVWRDLSVHVVVPAVGATPVRGWDDHVWGVPLMRMQSSLRWRRTRSLKRLTDVTVAGGALLALAPMLAVVSVLVRREVGPGIIFRQERVGLDGRPFEVLKFRSMRNVAPGENSPWTVDPSASDRVGPVGRFIRKYSIDELPQLWNIVRGDMSLVGPRPERPEYVTQFSAAYPHYEARHRAPVGLTGLAAVEGLRGDTSIADRAYFDNLYVESWSFWGDLKIVARTVSSVVRGTGA